MRRSSQKLGPVVVESTELYEAGVTMSSGSWESETEAVLRLGLKLGLQTIPLLEEAARLLVNRPHDEERERLQKLYDDVKYDLAARLAPYLTSANGGGPEATLLQECEEKKRPWSTPWRSVDGHEVYYLIMPRAGHRETVSFENVDGVGTRLRISGSAADIWDYLQNLEEASKTARENLRKFNEAREGGS